LEALRFDPIEIPGANALPTYLSSIARAADLGVDLMPEITSVVDAFGFTSFGYCATTHSTSIVEGRMYELSTLPMEWGLRYDEKGYVEIDPRVGAAFGRTTPLSWEQSTWIGKTVDVDQFLDDAAEFGVGSGVCIPLHDASFGVARFDFNSTIRHVHVDRQADIKRAFGDLSLAARLLHDLFVIAIRRNELRPRLNGMPLTQRERECLVLATRGLTASELACALGLDSRIVDMHFDSIRAKLGCLNRHEAIAHALKHGLGA